MCKNEGDALGFHMAPRWGWGGVIRSRHLPVGAGNAGFVTRLLRVGAGEAWYIGRPLPVGAGKGGFIVPVGLEVRHTGDTFSKFTRRAMT